MHSEHFLIFYRKITKSSIFFNENSHNIFVELFTPLIEMHKVNTNEVHVLQAKCKKKIIFLWKFSKFYILPHVCLWGNILFSDYLSSIIIYSFPFLSYIRSPYDILMWLIS